MKTLTLPTTLTKPKILAHIEAIEEYLQNLKGELYWISKEPVSKQRSIVNQTAGILNKKNTPSGVQYENKTRKGWSKRLTNL